MKSRLLLCGVIAYVVAVAMSSTPSRGQEASLPLDHHRLFRTHVPHLAGGSRGGGGAGGSGGSGAGAVFGGDPYNVGPTITTTTTGPEAEEHIAVDPNNGNNLLAGVSDFGDVRLLYGIFIGYNTSKYSFSDGNGAAGTWTDRYVPYDDLGLLLTADGRGWEANSDPVVAIDKSGNAFFANLYFNVFDNSNGLYVGVTSLASLGAAGTGFPFDQIYPVAVNPDPDTTLFEDKPWLAVDNSANPVTAGNAYVSWSRFYGNYDYIAFSRSIDHGQSWSTALRISPAAQDGAVQGSQVAVGPVAKST